MRAGIWLAATLTLLCATPTPSESSTTPSPYTEVRKAFQEAYARASANIADSGANDSESLKSYPLYPYLQSARIQQALASGTDPQSMVQVDQRAADFIAAYGQQPVARNLRRAWLESLARRTQWNQFLAVYRDTGASDAARCASFVARIELGKTEGLAADITKAWLTPRSLPECDRPFAWLKENGLLTTALIEERARLALDNNNPAFARQFIQQLPAERAGPLYQWSGLLESPARSIDALIASPGTSVNSTALLAGWRRLTRTDRDGAEERYPKLVRARGLSREAASPYALALALALAWNRDPAALDYFEKAVPTDFDEVAREWWVRAALWSKDWSLAQRVIATLSESNRQSARWRYWSARAAEQLHDAQRAQPLYEAILPDDNYYSAMAAVHLSRAVLPHPQALPVNAEVLATLDSIPGLVRARELLYCGMRPEAAAEWQAAFESLSPEARIQSIRLAADWGWYDQAVTVATSQHVFNDYALLYPRPYDAQVNAAARLTQLPPEIVYGVVRQESLYRIDAVSSAGARGLMQLQPATARSTARYYKRPAPAITDLFDPYINTALGAGRLRMLLDEFDDQIPVALAGYNAGPNAVSRWLPQEPLDSDIWIENIPYNETRGYVQRILWHSLMFTWLRTQGEALHADSWLTPILPVSRSEKGDRVAASDRATGADSKRKK
ncbi:MAG TPA: transglycosylase SLT domain-containing protein [Steroidobacteraceae bacterium]|nr:transglycosylase SLT domain-containing protein [Steroidobacteraceae bacterium]